MVRPGDIKFGRTISAALRASAEVQKQRTELFEIVRKIPVSPEVMRQASISEDLARKVVEKARSEGAIGRSLVDESTARLALDLGRGRASQDADLARMGNTVAVMIEAIDTTSRAWVTDLQRRIAESPAYQPMFQKMGEAASAFIEGQRALDDRADDFVERHGWPLPLRMQPQLFRQIVSQAGASRREVNAMMSATFVPGTRSFARTREVLLNSPHFESRKVLLSQAIKAFKREEWYLVVNGLLPLVEGVLIDVVYANDAAPKKSRAQKSVKRLLAVDESPFYGPLARGLEAMVIPSGAGIALFSGFEQSDYGRRGEPRDLNRDAILHGAARRYGSRQNALKLYLLLVMMAELLHLYEEKQKRARHRPPGGKAK